MKLTPCFNGINSLIPFRYFPKSSTQFEYLKLKQDPGLQPISDEWVAQIEFEFKPGIPLELRWNSRIAVDTDVALAFDDQTKAYWLARIVQISGNNLKVKWWLTIESQAYYGANTRYFLDNKIEEQHQSMGAILGTVSINKNGKINKSSHEKIMSLLIGW